VTRPERGVGRPRLPLNKDPDRYAVALLDAMLSLRFGSERACALAVATLVVGLEGGVERLSPDGRHVITNWEKNKTLKGATAGTLEGCAATLREKRRRYRSNADVHWRTAMSAAFRVVLTNPPNAKKFALLATETVGQGDFCRCVLFKMIDARISDQFPIHVK
jgi:hypothetical protein